MDIPQFIHSPLEVHFGCLQTWEIINKAVAINICVQAFVFSTVNTEQYGCLSTVSFALHFFSMLNIYFYDQS